MQWIRAVKQKILPRKNKEVKDGPAVEITSGIIRGYETVLEDGRIINSFLGVPFAQPPIGELRFQKPRPIKPWKGVRICVRHGPAAIQKQTVIEKFVLPPPSQTSEDCLYLNVFAPAWKSPNNQADGFPVIIFIHGGAYCIHSAAYYGDENICRCLCSLDVVVVTIQYRLGVLGFGTTGDHNFPPNLGLWDQALALQWVKDNIGFFGGDPNNITVVGQSAGAACADMLSLSPHTSYLFDKVIVMSGAASCSWSINSMEHTKESTARLAKKFGWRSKENCDEATNNASMVEVLRQQAARRLGSGLVPPLGLKSLPRFKRFDFAPVIDNDFFPEPIAALRKKAPRKVCIAGTTEYEGLFFAVIGDMRYGRKAFLRLIDMILPNVESGIKQKAINLYSDGDYIMISTCKSTMNLLGDIIINNGVHRYALEMLDAGHKVYLYNFEYHPTHFGPIGWLFPFMAATHGTELPYMFGKPIVQRFKFTNIDYKVLRNCVTMLTNFAKYSDPNTDNGEQWEPLDSSNLWRHLNINEKNEIREDFKGKRAIFWESMMVKMVTCDPLPMRLFS